MKGLALFTLVLLNIGINVAINPGLKMRLTRNGLNYVNTIAQAALAKDLQGLHIDDQSGSSGDIQWSLTNIQTEGVTVPSTGLDFNPGLNGLSLSITNFGINIHADWRVKYKKGIIKISDSGSVSVGVHGVSTSVTVGIGADPQSRPSISTRACSANVDDVSIDFHGGTAFIWNLFKHPLEDKVKGILRDKICTIVVNAINVKAEAKLAKMRVDVEIDHRFLLDYGLVAPVSFTGAYMESQHRGEVYWKDDKRESPFTPPVIPDSPDVSNMLYLYLTEYTAQTFAYTAQQHGFLVYNLTKKDLPADSQSFLNTTCDDFKCIGSLISKIGRLYPNSSVEIRISSTSDPKFKVATTGLTMGLYSNLSLFARSLNGSEHYLATLNMSLALTGTASIASEKVVGQITNHSFELGLVDSAIGPILVRVLQTNLETILRLFVLPKFNEFAAKGFDLPVSEDLKFLNSRLILMDGFLVVATDVVLKIKQPETLRFAPEVFQHYSS